MRVIKNIEDLTPGVWRSVAIGNFDGVHLGHQAIIQELKSLRPEIVVTFDPHPGEILSRENLGGVITSASEKIEILGELGVENLFILKFDEGLANMEATEFIKWLMVEYMKPKKVVVGYNHRFGRGAKGDFELLVHMGARFGFETIRVPPVYVEGFPVSSTRVRNALANGKIELVSKLLGRPYSITSQVIAGKKRGVKLSYPTANLKTPEKKLIPKRGVYAVRVEHKNQKFAGMMNIGERPTFGDGFRIEVHIFDFDKDLLHEQLKIEFMRYLRESRVFESAGALKTQLGKDELLARKLLSERRGGED